MESLPLSAGNVLHLVRLADRAILITSSPSGCHVVENSPWASVENHLSEARLDQAVVERPPTRLMAIRAVLLFVMLLMSPAIHAAAAPGPLLGASLTNGGQAISAPMQIVIVMTLLTLLPAVLMSVTPFLRIVIVLHFLRQALGTQSTPSNQVLVGLALFLSILVMQPVAVDMYHKG